MKPRQFRHTRRFRVAGMEDAKMASLPTSSPQDDLLPPFEPDAPRPPQAASHETLGPREVIEQAARDIRRGLRDTDRHGTPSDVPGPGPDPEHSPGAELPVIDAGKDSKQTPRKP